MVQQEITIDMFKTILHLETICPFHPLESPEKLLETGKSLLTYLMAQQRSPCCQIANIETHISDIFSLTTRLEDEIRSRKN